ncbi:MAG: plastocyanin/azurin family copper-binding protein [Solirubrobacteraceae bacterium]
MALTAGLCAPTPSGAAEETVSIVNSHYQPTPITVSLGDTVTWINEGFLLHTVTATNGEFASGRLHGGQRFSVRFDKPGTFDYVCTIHPRMSGKVIVAGQSSGHGGGGGEPSTPKSQTSTPAGTAHVSLKLLKATSGGRRVTRIAVTTSRPRGQVLLQLYSREHFAWIQVAHATLGASGGATFEVRSRLHRRVRAVVMGGPGEGPSISSVLRT